MPSCKPPSSTSPTPFQASRSPLTAAPLHRASVGRSLTETTVSGQPRSHSNLPHPSPTARRPPFFRLTSVLEWTGSVHPCCRRPRTAQAPYRRTGWEPMGTRQSSENMSPYTRGTQEWFGSLARDSEKRAPESNKGHRPCRFVPAHRTPSGWHVCAISWSSSTAGAGFGGRVCGS